MGEVFGNNRPIFSADIVGSHKGFEIYGVVDGLRHPVEIDKGKLILIPVAELTEKFHVVTFVANQPVRGEQRTTRIIYIKEN